MKRIFLICVIALLSISLFSGCSDDKDQTYLYSVGIDGYRYDGPTLLGPMLYLQSLNIARSLSVVSDTREDADRQAMVKFGTEMDKIDADSLATYGTTVYVRYVLQFWGEEQEVIQEKVFGSE